MLFHDFYEEILINDPIEEFDPEKSIVISHENSWDDVDSVELEFSNDFNDSEFWIQYDSNQSKNEEVKAPENGFYSTWVGKQNNWYDDWYNKSADWPKVEDEDEFN